MYKEKPQQQFRYLWMSNFSRIEGHKDGVLEAAKCLVGVLENEREISPSLTTLFFHSVFDYQNYDSFLESTHKLKWLTEETSKMLVINSASQSEEQIFIKILVAETQMKLNSWKWAHPNKTDGHPVESAIQKGLLDIRRTNAEPVVFIDPYVKSRLAPQVLKLDKSVMGLGLQLSVGAEAQEVLDQAATGNWNLECSKPLFGLDEFDLYPNPLVDVGIWGHN